MKEAKDYDNGVQDATIQAIGKQVEALTAQVAELSKLVWILWGKAGLVGGVAGAVVSAAVSVGVALFCKK